MKRNHVYPLNFFFLFHGKRSISDDDSPIQLQMFSSLALMAQLFVFFPPPQKIEQNTKNLTEYYVLKCSHISLLDFDFYCPL